MNYFVGIYIRGEFKVFWSIYIYNMAQELPQLRQARDNASRLYNVALQAPENDLADYPEDLTPEQQVIRQRQISQRLYIANQAWYNAAVAYRDAIQIDNNATPEAKQEARDYVRYFDRVPEPEPVGGGRRRRSSTSRKSPSSRRRRSTKRRTTSRKQQKRRRGSRRAH